MSADDDDGDVADNGVRSSTGKCGALRKPNWLLVRTHTYLLTHLMI